MHKTEAGLTVKEVHGDLYDKPFSILVQSSNNYFLTACLIAILFEVQGIEASFSCTESHEWLNFMERERWINAWSLETTKDSI